MACLIFAASVNEQVTVVVTPAVNRLPLAGRSHGAYQITGACCIRNRCTGSTGADNDGGWHRNLGWGGIFNCDGEGTIYAITGSIFSLATHTIGTQSQNSAR